MKGYINQCLVLTHFLALIHLKESTVPSHWTERFTTAPVIHKREKKKSPPPINLPLLRRCTRFSAGALGNAEFEEVLEVILINLIKVGASYLLRYTV